MEQAGPRNRLTAEDIREVLRYLISFKAVKAFANLVGWYVHDHIAPKAKMKIAGNPRIQVRIRSDDIFEPHTMRTGDIQQGFLVGGLHRCDGTDQVYICRRKHVGSSRGHRRRQCRGNN